MPHSCLLTIKNVSDRSCRGNRNPHFIFNKIFFRKSWRLWDNVAKYCRTGQATDVNMAHAHFMPDTKGYKHTLRICNTYCFSTATLVTRKRLNVTLYVHCLYCVCTISGRRSQGQAVALHSHYFQHNSKKLMNSGFRREVDENCARLGYYAASSDSIRFGTTYRSHL